MTLELAAVTAYLPESFIKRDGSRVPFDAEKIFSAILRAGGATGEFGEAEARLLTAQVTKVLSLRHDREHPPSVERTQDIVEQVLITANHLKTARAYIVYREQHRKLRQDGHTLLDVAQSVNEYLDRADWRVAANANQGYSLGGLILNTSGKVIANYWLDHVYPPEVGEAHRNADLHIHDLDMLAGYCAGWSLRSLLAEGLNGVPGKVEAGPPKHLSSAVGQIVNFLGTLQNEWAGAQAFSSFDTYMAPFIRQDRLPYDQVKQGVQELIYNLNVPSRWGTQCVDEETECLTNHGWRRYHELTPDDQILTFNCTTEAYEYLTPLAVTAYDFEGDMYVLRNRSQEQWITPGHRVVRKTFNTRDYWRLQPIEEVLNLKLPLIVPSAWETSSILEIEDRLVEFLAGKISQADFDASSLDSSLANRENLRRACTARDGLEYPDLVREAAGGCPGGQPSCPIPLNKAGRGFQWRSGYPERVPPVIRTLSVRQIRLFLQICARANGSAEARDEMRIYTTDKEKLDGLQELCALAGYGSSVSRDQEAGVYALEIFPTKETPIDSIERRAYQGKVWCPTTRNDTFVARRRGKTFVTGNTPFTNLTFDWVCPEDLREQVPIIAGQEMPFTYGALQPEMDMINRAYIEVMTEGDTKGRVFTFPIPTYNITPDFPWKSENTDRLFEMAAKYGLPYFQNFLGSELKPNMIRSMCCRLQLDLRELMKRGNGLFGSAEQTGSLGVVTLNCARLGYTHRGNEVGLLKRLDQLLELARNSLEIKRKVIQRHMDAGLFPYTKRYLGILRNHFSTIGVNGINEMIRNFSDDAHDITSEWGQAFAGRLLDHIRDRMVEFQEQTGHMYNLEATPAEGTTYRFAKEDRKRFAGILQAGTTEQPYYTNSSQLPVGYTDDPFEALERQEALQAKYTGGTVLHLYMSERISSTDACKRLVRRALENFRIPYLTVTPTFSICPKHGYLSGEHEFCPLCDEELLERVFHEQRTERCDA